MVLVGTWGQGVFRAPLETPPFRLVTAAAGGGLGRGGAGGEQAGGALQAHAQGVGHRGAALAEAEAAYRQIYDEHMRLKNHRVIRMLRSLRLFDIARRVVPGAKKFLGTGHRPGQSQG